MTKLVRFDWAIKYLLRNKANFDILEGFLSELLIDDIKIESILESEGNKDSKDDKYNRVDLLVHAGKKERIIIEVQCSSEWDYLSRILYGTSKTVTEHMREGSPYSNISKVISVSIVFFNLGEGKDYLYKGTTSFHGMHYKDVLKLGPKELELYGQDQTPSDIFPEYYIIKVNEFNEKIKDKFDEWMYFLKNEKIKPTFRARGLQSAAYKLDVLRLSAEERRKYEGYQEYRHYEASMALSYHVEVKVKEKELKAREKELNAKLKAREKELNAREREFKLREQEAEARRELQIQQKVAASLKCSGMSVDQIAQHTKLTEEEILKL